MINTAIMDKEVTLRQGLTNFHNDYKDHLSHEQEGISIEARLFFESHDIAHVLFDCDISLCGEAKVKLWTIFGTTLGFWGHIKSYRDASAYQLAKRFSLIHILRNIGLLLSTVPRVIYRAKNMSKPWEWDKFAVYLDQPLSDIRSEFNIEVL